MRQVLPSLLKTPHRGQESSICEFEKGAGGGWPSEASRLPRSVFSKSSFPKLTPHISDNFCPRQADSEEEGILIAAPQKVSARQRGKGSGDGPRCAADRDAAFQRWPSMPGKSGRDPSGGSFGSREASSWPTGRVVRRFFARSPPTTAWDILLKQSPRSAQSKLDYSEK